MAQVTNLDAHIPREDFLAVEGADAGQAGKNSASATDLTVGESFFSTLRKPDFQRETAAWSPEAVRDCILAFVDGDLIPAVICWQSPTRLSFVIDGAHRLSAIIAWLCDDYGAGSISNKFYGHQIPEPQRKIAGRTKQLVDEAIKGTYQDVKTETKSPGSFPQLAEYAKKIGHSTIPLLWVKGPDAKKAERAFFTINRSAVEIDPTELRILRTRFTPAAITARTIVRNATGHNYWSAFSAAGQADLVKSAKHINKLLYEPPLQDVIKNIDLPIAGPGYGTQTLPLVFDFVNIANGFSIVDASKTAGKKSFEALSDTAQTPNEIETLTCITQTKRLIERLTGLEPSSLGLHPAIYFYAASGRHQPTAVLAVADLIHDLVKTNKLIEFTTVRSRFEDFLREHKTFVNQLTVQHGSMAKGYKQIRDYFAFVLEQFLSGGDAVATVAALQSHEKYQRLVKDKPVLTKKAKDFSKETKQFVIIKKSLEQAFVCSLCGAKVDNKAMNFDHIVDQKHEGVGVAANAGLTHPYCNSIKDKLAQLGFQAPNV